MVRLFECYLKESAIYKTILSFLGWVMVSLILSGSMNPSVEEPDASCPHQKKLIKILSIDGGGVRGLIPTLILQALESKLKNKRHLADCFDIMAGTSTGGIIVLLLNTPQTDGTPKFRVSDVVYLYKNISPKIFDQSIWNYIKTFNGWLGQKYSAGNLEKSAQEYFGDTQLRDSITNVIIPAYDISRDETIFFKTDRAKRDQQENFYFKDIARATSAAPTYFKPAKVADVILKNTYDLIDGGVAINNPSLEAWVHAIKLFGKDNDFLVVSLGAGTNYGVPAGKISYSNKEIKSGGKIEWANDIVSTLMYAANDVVDYQLNEIFTTEDLFKQYFRLQPILLDPAHTSIDNTNPKNIRVLEKYAADIIANHDSDLTEIARRIDNTGEEL